MSTDLRTTGVRDPHDVLGVPRGADRGQVTRAFHRKALRGGHPDTGGDAHTFDELVRARDVLLGSGRTAARRSGRASHASAPATSGPATIGADAPSHRPSPAPGHGPIRPRMNRLAVVSTLFVFLGPLFWVPAIVVGRVALRQIKRTGEGGDTLVPLVLGFLYVCTLPALVPVVAAVAAG